MPIKGWHQNEAPLHPGKAGAKADIRRQLIKLGGSGKGLKSA